MLFTIFDIISNVWCCLQCVISSTTCVVVYNVWYHLQCVMLSTMCDTVYNVWYRLQCVMLSTMVWCMCNVCSAWTDQMSSSDSVAAQLRTLAGWVINMSVVIILARGISWLSESDPATHTHTHAHTHTRTHTHRESFYFCLAQLPLLFQHKFKWRMKVPNIIESKP